MANVIFTIFNFEVGILIVEKIYKYRKTLSFTVVFVYGHYCAAGVRQVL